MPRALFWEQAKPGTKIDGPGDRDEVLKTLIETFGRDPHHPLSPIELDKAKVFTLRQMGGPTTLYGVIADLIEAHGKIRVWGRD